MDPDVPRAVTCSQAVFDRIVTAMQAALPSEGVVVLGGSRSAALLHITHVAVVPNQCSSSTNCSDRFAIAPEAFAQAWQSLSPTTFQGFAHSHPGAEPCPSGTDERELWRHCLHAIAGNVDGTWRVRWFWRSATDFLPLPCVFAEP